jgi:hypothetical protein
MSIRAIRHTFFKIHDAGAGDRFFGWKVYINGKKYPLGKGNYYLTDDNEEGKQHAIEQATNDVVNSILPNHGWVSKDVTHMSDYEWETYNSDRIDAFYVAGNKFKPSKTCSMCDHYNDYICLEHEILQLDEKGFL